jgi:hypothetical protein
MMEVDRFGRDQERSSAGDEDLKAYLTRMEGQLARMDDRMTQMEDRLSQRIEKVETSLLTEFHKWASPVESKLRTHRSWFYEVDAEVELLKERIKKLEARNPS